jgi:hypothetical protein
VDLATSSGSTSGCLPAGGGTLGPLKLEGCVTGLSAIASSAAGSNVLSYFALKRIILQQLRVMNIEPQFLFPSIDGLGRSLADLARLKAAQARRTV